MNSLLNAPAGGYLLFDSYRDCRLFCVWFPPVSAALIIDLYMDRVCFTLEP